MSKQVINFLRKLVTNHDQSSLAPQIWAVKAPNLVLKIYSFGLSLSNFSTIEFLRKSKSMTRYELCKKLIFHRVRYQIGMNGRSLHKKHWKKYAVRLILHYLSFFCFH